MSSIIKRINDLEQKLNKDDIMILERIKKIEDFLEKELDFNPILKRKLNNH